MGKFSGKLLTLYITPSGVRVCEGDNHDGNPNITKFFTVFGVKEYFSNLATSQAPEITNMSGLVSTIVDECKNRHISTRRVLVCSDCFGVSTEIRFEKASGLKAAMTGDVKDVLKSITSSKESAAPDQVLCTQSWGETSRDGVIYSTNTRTVCDKYTLKSLVQEFYNYGYEVIFVSGSQEVLMNFRNTELASFDSQGKIIFDYDVDARCTVFVRDVPVELSQMNMLEKENMYERLMSQIRQAIGSTGRNPKIYLAGGFFADTEIYNTYIDLLESEGYTVFDLFGRPNKPADDSEEAEQILTPDYSANIAMLMCSHVRSLINLTPGIGLVDVLKRNAKALSLIALTGSITLFAVTGGMAVERAINLYKMNQNPSRLGSLQSQLSSLSSKRTSLESTLSTLTQADTTVLEVLEFVNTNQTDRVCIVSIDTKDMIPAGITVDGAQVDTSEDDIVSGESFSEGYTGLAREPIILRGYARSGTEAVTYFDKLFKADLPSDPVLNGVERYELPDGDEVYIFEIEIGGVTSE